MNTQEYGAVEQCFANRNGAGCKIMESELCAGVCVFYKTLDALKRERALAFARIAGLPAEHQSYIAEKYFNGRQPWINQACLL